VDSPDSLVLWPDTSSPASCCCKARFLNRRSCHQNSQRFSHWQ
jgi:hypothetical protein